MSRKQTWRPAGPERTETVIGHPGSVEFLRRSKELGVKAIQVSVSWRSAEPEEGRFDFSRVERRAEEIVSCGLMWTPHLSFANAVPDWFVEKGLSLKQRCVEHAKENGQQSIFNPHLREQLGRYFRAFDEHFTGRLRDAIYETELFCCQYGEPNYFFIDRSGPRVAGWGGALHHGFQCGDEFARNALRQAMRVKYGSIEALNDAWETGLGSFDEVEFAVPAAECEDLKNDFTDTFDEATKTYRFDTHVQGRLAMGRRWVDQVTWYRDAMNDYLEFIVATARQVFGDRRLAARLGGCSYLCWLGSQAAKNVKSVARHGVEVRFTGAVHPYDQKVLSTACRYYRTPMWTEPMYALGRRTGPTMMRARRWFDAVFYGASCGQSITREEYTNSFFAKGETVEENFPVYKRAVEAAAIGRPFVRFATFLPTTQSCFGFDHRYFMGTLDALLDYTDADVVDEFLVAEGALRRYDALLVRMGGFVEAETIERLKAYVRDGGLIAFGPRGTLKTLDDGSAGEALAGEMPSEGTELRRVGDGGVLLCADDTDDVLIPAFLAAAGEVAGVEVIDGRPDGVLTTQLGEEVLAFNTNDEPVEVELAGRKVAIEAYDEQSLPLARVAVDAPGATIESVELTPADGGFDVSVAASDQAAGGYVELRRPDYRTVYVDLSLEDGRLAGLVETPMAGRYEMAVFVLDAVGRETCMRRLQAELP